MLQATARGSISRGSKLDRLGDMTGGFRPASQAPFDQTASREDDGTIRQGARGQFQFLQRMVVIAFGIIVETGMREMRLACVRG